MTVTAGPANDVRTYAFENEDHTLGNVLRYSLMKHRDVEGAGYNIPHPSEAIMNVWVQTRNGTSADDALEQSLSNVEDMCEHLSYVYAEALKDFKEKQRQESSGKPGAAASTRKKAEVEVDAEADVEMADADATSAAQRCATKNGEKTTIVEGQEDAAEKGAEKKKKKKKKKDHKED
eukprot:g14318.t1